MEKNCEVKAPYDKGAFTCQKTLQANPQTLTSFLKEGKELLAETAFP